MVCQRKKALDEWLRNGGGVLTYSDSASGGHFGEVGLRNPVGQQTVNNLISAYGMEVATDQGGGVRSYRPVSDTVHPVVDGLVLEGEGVSPVAVQVTSGAKILIPLSESALVDEKRPLKINPSGITLEEYDWAALAMAPVEKGHIAVLFDRQPMWNAGPGSDIRRKDNREILRRLIRFLANDL